MELRWLESELLADVIHGSFLRHGGVSEGVYSSLNCCGRGGDVVERVQENHRRIREALEVETLVYGDQEHGVKVVEVTGPMAPGVHDALMTDVAGLGLMILHADCQPILLYDPVRRAVAAVHCGWRGNAQNIIGVVVEAMQGRYGTLPENLLAYIGPSLGPERGELRGYEQLLPQELWEFQIRPNYFDLWAVSRFQLERSGVAPENIEISGVCSYSSPDCFSYRREKTTGRLGTVIGLRPRHYRSY
jgi:hypothetical protein